MSEKWPSIIGRLRRAVNKVRFLLSFSLHRWLSSANLGSSIGRHRQLSFGDRPGLRLCHDEPQSSTGSGSGSSFSRQLSFQRTISSPAAYIISDKEEEDKEEYEDIDKKADMFIANFYRQLQIERQISLELQYCRGNSFESAKSPY